jgi:predicted RNase H-like HicB family nuclease
MIATHHDYRGYVFRIEYEPSDPAYSVEFEDFPEIISSGSSLSDAFANACEALDLHLESLAKLGKKPPRAKSKLVVVSGRTKG